MVIIEISDDVSQQELSITDLPSNWNSFPHPKELVAFTEQWIKENKFSVRRVPAVHSLFEWNYLINPLHPEANRLKIIEDFAHEFDPRLK